MFLKCMSGGGGGLYVMYLVLNQEKLCSLAVQTICKDNNHHSYDVVVLPVKNGIILYNIQFCLYYFTRFNILITCHIWLLMLLYNITHFDNASTG